MKHSCNNILTFSLLFLSTQICSADLMFNNNIFPHPPIQGTFIVEKTIPDLSSIPSSQYDSSLFMPGQRIEFSYDGEVGSDWQGYYEYSMTVYPPYDQRMCEQDHWQHYCEYSNKKKQMPARPITQDLVLSSTRIKNKKDLESSKEFLPYGLKISDFIYSGNTSDSGIGYSAFYFTDWNTLISTTYYYSISRKIPDNVETKKLNIALQILKRVDENARAPYRPMVR